MLKLEFFPRVLSKIVGFLCCSATLFHTMHLIQSHSRCLVLWTSMSRSTFATVIPVLFILRKHLSSEASSLKFREWVQTISRTVLRSIYFVALPAFTKLFKAIDFPPVQPLNTLSIRFIAVVWSLRPSAGIRKTLERQLRDLNTPLPGPQITVVSTTHPCRTNSNKDTFHQRPNADDTTTLDNWWGTLCHRVGVFELWLLISLWW